MSYVLQSRIEWGKGGVRHVGEKNQGVEWRDGRLTVGRGVRAESGVRVGRGVKV